MTQHRDLVPSSVYLPPAAKTQAEQRAAKKHMAVGTLLRLILLGEEPPLKA